MDGPEFYCDHCRDKGMAADKLADLKDANDIDPPPEDIQPGNIPDEPKDSTPPDNIPDKTKDTTNMPPPENRPPETKDTKDTKDNDGDADKETDDPPSVNPGVSELYDPDIFYEAFSVEDEDGKRKLDLDRMVLDVMDSKGFEAWHDFIQDRFEDSEKKATPAWRSKVSGFSMADDVLRTNS